MLIGNWLARNCHPCQLISGSDELKLTVFKHRLGREREQGHQDLWELEGMWFLLPSTAVRVGGAVILLPRADRSAKTNSKCRWM